MGMHEIELRVRWGELDSYGHVNHAAYLTYLETARIAALESVGLGMRALAESGAMILVADLRVRYRRPAVDGDILTVRTAVTEVRPASTVWRQEILRAGARLVQADVVGAITDLDGRPRRIPDELANPLAALKA